MPSCWSSRGCCHGWRRVSGADPRGRSSRSPHESGGALCADCASLGEPVDAIVLGAFADLIGRPLAEAAEACPPAARRGRRAHRRPRPAGASWRRAALRRPPLGDRMHPLLQVGRLAASQPTGRTFGGSELSGRHQQPQRVLGLARLRADEPVPHGGRRRHVQPGDVAALPRGGPVALRVRRAVDPPDRRALRREPVPAAALLPVPGAAQALAARTCRTCTWAR